MNSNCYISESTKNIMPQVLVVENSKRPLRSVKKLLSSINYSIAFETSNGFEAVEKYELVKPDLVIMDLFPSKNEGLEIIKAIKKKHSESQIVVMSVIQDSDLFEKCIQAGASKYFSIPFNLQEFVSLISTMDSVPNTKNPVAPVVLDEN